MYAFNGVSLTGFEVIELGWSPEGVISRPVVTWLTPAPIVQGTPLGAAELNATANASGTYIYTPAAGTVLAAGTHTLATAFTPSDATRYNSATASMTVTVNPAVKTTPVIDWKTPSAIVQGTALTAPRTCGTTFAGSK